MSELTTVARPYAKAAFDFAVEKNAVAKWQEMLAFAGAVAANDDMHQLLSGAVAADTLADIFNNVCGEQLDEHGQNLVKVLAENKRLAALPEISTASLEKRLARKVKLNCNVDPALIAGMVINAGDTVIDGSVKSKLNRLADALQA